MADDTTPANVCAVRALEDALGTYRCRVRACGCTFSVDCVAPSESAAAHVVGSEALLQDPAPWVQVVVSRWSPILRTYVVGPNAIVIVRGDPAPRGTERVILLSNGVESRDEPRRR